MAASPSLRDRHAIEDYLYVEADLLDRWRLDDWFALFDKGAHYEVPGTDSPEDATADTSLFYIADDYVRLKYRIERLKSKNAHSEFPHSRVFRMVGNVRWLGGDDASAEYDCKFITNRSRDDITDHYFGRHRYQFALTAGRIRIVKKRTTLDTGSLRPQGRISIIL